MTEIERKALELVNEVRAEYGYTTPITFGWFSANSFEHMAFLRAIEQHEAFRQEVSDAVEHFKRCYPGYQHASLFDRFIITKHDPLVEAMAECGVDPFESWADQFRAALAKRGLEIREKE
jgi:hypothetical protein